MGWGFGEKRLRVIIGFIIDEFIWRLRILSAIMAKVNIVVAGSCVSFKLVTARSFTHMIVTIFTTWHCPLISVLNSIESCPMRKSTGLYSSSILRGRIAFRILIKISLFN
jgi:hypothetical protein